jgi:hypothetical protein
MSGRKPTKPAKLPFAITRALVQIRKRREKEGANNKRGGAVLLHSVRVGTRWYLRCGNHLYKLEHDRLIPAFKIDMYASYVILHEVKFVDGFIDYQPMRAYTSRNDIRGTHLCEIQ